MTNEGVLAEFRPNLRDDARARARERILKGASAAIVRWGLEATYDQVADEAGVSKRTVFRHFPTHSELIGATIRESITAVGRLLPPTPQPGEDVRVWLDRALVDLHQIVRQLTGRAFWDIHEPRPGTPPETVDALAQIVVFRKRYAGSLAQSAWTGVGGDGAPPQWIKDAFEVHASGFATFALPAYSPQETGHLSARVLWEVLQAGLREASGSPESS